MTTPDTDVNDDGLTDVIVPTRHCWPEGLTPIPAHGPHMFKDFARPPNWWRCPGNPTTTPHDLRALADGN